MCNILFRHLYLPCGCLWRYEVSSSSIYFQRTHGPSSQCVRHRAIKSTPQTTTYTWHDVSFPSPHNAEGQRPMAPQNRCKHAACLHGDHIYIYGGRNGGTCHGDLWRYCLSDQTWMEVTCHGDPPQSPQEHTMLAYKVNNDVLLTCLCKFMKN